MNESLNIYVSADWIAIKKGSKDDESSIATHGYNKNNSYSHNHDRSEKGSRKCYNFLSKLFSFKTVLKKTIFKNGTYIFAFLKFGMARHL